MDVDSPQFLEDPYRFYRERLTEPHLRKVNAFIWSSTRFDAISQILVCPEAGRGNIGQTPQPDADTTRLDLLKKDNPAIEVLHNWMLFNNPPRHTTLRQAVLDVFTNKMVMQLEHSIRNTIVTLIEKIQANGNRQFDLISQLAYPFPISIICELLGIPENDRVRFQDWTSAFAVAVQADFMIIDSATRAHINRSALELKAYFNGLIELKRGTNADDLISRLISAGEGGLSNDEIIGNCVLFLFAGQETTTSSLGNAINSLLNHPRQYQLLREDHTLIPNAVEECLRYDPPVQMVSRVALEDFMVLNQTIKKGEHCYLFIGAAGRDPDINPEPDRFDVLRKKIRHLAFARGQHHCLGAVLARLELKIVFQEIIRTFPELKLAGPGIRNRTWLMRGFRSLPLSF